MTTKTYVDAMTPVPQAVPFPGREAEMVKNAAGGYVFAVDDWKRLDRFLILGSDSGTFYANAREHTLDNVAVVKRCAQADGLRTVARIVEVSQKNLAPKNAPAIVALAVVAANSGKRNEHQEVRHAAYDALPLVCRTATHLFQWAELTEKLGGWGTGKRLAVQRWYQEKRFDPLAYQMVKYRQREGWTHRDMLRLSHPKPRPGDERGWLLRWAVGKMPELGTPPRIVEGFLKAQHAANPKETARLIREYGLPREAVNTDHLHDIEVWDALIEDMPLWAMIRNLGNMTSIGLLKPFAARVGTVVAALNDTENLRKSRVHPMTVLIGQRTYAQGHGTLGHKRWSPVQQIVDALDGAFYGAMGNVPTTGKRFLAAVDVSGSMQQQQIANLPMTPTEAAAAMALILAKVEPNTYILGWHTQPAELRISPGMRLADAVNACRAFGGGTDATVPITWLLREKLEVDAIVSYTDNESWAGQQHVVTALDHYRRGSAYANVSVPNARYISVAFTATRGSVADQKDPLSMDCVGLDTSTASVISGFASGQW